MCVPLCASTAPMQLPASPGLGIIQILSAPFQCSTILLLALQFKAQPPINTRLLLAYVLATTLLILVNICSYAHCVPDATSYAHCVNSCLPSTILNAILVGSHHMHPLCRLCRSWKLGRRLKIFKWLGNCSQKSFNIVSPYLPASPYAAIPISMYSSSFGFSPMRCVIALYQIPMLLG